METVVCRDQTYVLLPKEYWHLVHPTKGDMFHNAYLQEGLLRSASAISRIDGLELVVSPYSLTAMTDDKEQVWERVRASSFGSLPSRVRALFLLDSKDIVTRVLREWFGNEGRHVVKSRIVAMSAFHRADAKWLDCLENDWEDHARRYWSGEMSDDPIPEVLVDGAVYFPDWREPPFGMLQG